MRGVQPGAPLEDYVIEYHRFDGRQVHFMVHPCEVTLLSINDLIIERCTRGRKRIRQIAAHDNASGASVRGLPVRQDPISAPGAHRYASCTPPGHIFVRLFGRVTKRGAERSSETGRCLEYVISEGGA